MEENNDGPKLEHSAPRSLGLWDMHEITMLSKEHVHSIGLFVIFFNDLEKLVEHAIWRLLKLEWDMGVAVTSHVTSYQKLDMFESICHEKVIQKDVLEETLLCLGDIRRINTKRNRIVHAYWYFSSHSTGKAGYLRETAKGKIKREMAEFTSSDIFNLCKEVMVQTGRLQSLFFSVSEGHPHYDPDYVAEPTL